MPKCQKCNINYNSTKLSSIRKTYKKSDVKYFRNLYHCCDKCIMEELEKRKNMSDEEIENDNKKAEKEEIKHRRMKNINWEDPKVIIITILIFIFLFALAISVKRDYFPNNYPKPRPLDAMY